MGGPESFEYTPLDAAEGKPTPEDIKAEEEVKEIVAEQAEEKKHPEEKVRKGIIGTIAKHGRAAAAGLGMLAATEVTQLAEPADAEGMLVQLGNEAEYSEYNSLIEKQEQAGKEAWTELLKVKNNPELARQIFNKFVVTHYNIRNPGSTGKENMGVMDRMLARDVLKSTTNHACGINKGAACNLVERYKFTSDFNKTPAGIEVFGKW